ncbi:hypothetical protein IKF15_00730, partial [Candidatus Saccharibacteria bacterium]|nr:hypothetical protein [Candidatus Saccharibacteria bacterium]
MDSQDPDDNTDDILDPSLVHLYGASGSGTEITDASINKAGQADGIGTFELTDIRDTKTYLVRRFADGNCWMVQNLDLDLSTVGTLKPENSDVSEEWDPYGKVATADFPTWSLENLGIAQTHQYQPYGTSGNNYHWGSRLNESGVLLDGTNGSDGNSTMTQIGSTGIYVENNSKSEIARSYDNGSDWINNIATSNADGTSDDYKTSGTPTSPTEYMGDYYNWYAATAESGTYAMTSGNASSSICPLGWQLPVNGAANDKSWGKLITTTYGIGSNVAGSRSLRSFPLSVIMSGLYSWIGGSLGRRGTGGYYWSSTPYAATNSRSLLFSSTGVSPQGDINKPDGFSVRCVARGTENQVTPPEDVVQSTCSSNSICYDANGGTGNTMANTGSAT